MSVTVALADDLDNPVAGAMVSASLVREEGGSWTFSGPTGVGGTVAQQFKLFLLGVPKMVWQDQPFKLARRQARALLYFLAHELQPAPRNRLTFLLWPDIPDATARRIPSNSRV